MSIQSGFDAIAQGIIRRKNFQRQKAALQAKQAKELKTNEIYSSGLKSLYGSTTSGASVPAPVAASGSSKKSKDFFNKMMPSAIEASRRTGIDPRIIVAQAALESGYGRRALGNNYFGIKSHGKKGGQKFRTHEVINGKRVSITDSFRKYGGAEDSTRGYADFMLNNKRYEKLRNSKGLDAQLAALQSSGYATDPNYSKKIGSIARKISLPTGGSVPQQSNVQPNVQPNNIVPASHREGMRFADENTEGFGPSSSIRRSFPNLGGPPVAPSVGGGAPQVLPQPAGAPRPSVPSAPPTGAAPLPPLQPRPVVGPAAGIPNDAAPVSALPVARPAPSAGINSNIPPVPQQSPVGQFSPQAMPPQLQAALSNPNLPVGMKDSLLKAWEGKQSALRGQHNRTVDRTNSVNDYNRGRNASAFDHSRGRNEKLQDYNRTRDGKRTDNAVKLVSIDEAKQLGLNPAVRWQVDANGRYSAITKGGVEVNIDNGGNNVPEFSKLPAGFAYKRDENNQIIKDSNGIPIALPIPNTPAAEELRNKKLAGEIKQHNNQRTANIVTTDIDRAISIIEQGGLRLPVTGFGAESASSVGGSDSNAVGNLISTIKANAGFDKLQAMRDASPTGGALGQVSERELAYLQSAIGSLSQSQSEEQLIYNLNRVKSIYNDVVNLGKLKDQLNPDGTLIVRGTPNSVNGKTGGSVPSNMSNQQLLDVLSQ